MARALWLVPDGEKEKYEQGLPPAAHVSGAPFTLHPTPYTLHPTSYTLHPTPYTLHPTPYTLHHTPSTLKQGELGRIGVNGFDRVDNVLLELVPHPPWRQPRGKLVVS